MSALPWYGTDRIAALLPMADAIDVLERTLAGGFDPAGDPARSVVPVTHEDSCCSCRPRRDPTSA